MTDTTTAKPSKREQAVAREAKAEAAHRAAVERGEVATPVRYTVSLSGSSDDGDIEAIRDAYRTFVRALRDAGKVIVGGYLNAQVVDARHPGTGVLVPGTVVNDNAVDVEDE